MTLEPATAVEGAGKTGVVVADVDPDGAAAQKGLQTGDVILEVAGKAVSRPSEVTAAIDSAKSDGKKSVLMRVKNDNGTHFVALSTAGRLVRPRPGSGGAASPRPSPDPAAGRPAGRPAAVFSDAVLKGREAGSMTPREAASSRYGPAREDGFAAGRRIRRQAGSRSPACRSVIS